MSRSVHDEDTIRPKLSLAHYLMPSHIGLALLTALILIAAEAYFAKQRMVLTIPIDTPTMLITFLTANIVGLLGFHAGYSGKVENTMKSEMNEVTKLVEVIANSSMKLTESEVSNIITQIKQHTRDSMSIESTLMSVHYNYFLGTLVAVLGIVSLYLNLLGFDFVGAVMSVYFLLIALTQGQLLIRKISHRTLFDMIYW